MGYATKTAMELIQHLYANYARIYAENMASNDDLLRSPYNAEETKEGLIGRLNKYSDFAA